MKFTTGGGRLISLDGRPFITIGRAGMPQNGTDPVLVDGITLVICDLLNANPDAIVEKMGRYYVSCPRMLAEHGKQSTTE